MRALGLAGFLVALGPARVSAEGLLTEPIVGGAFQVTPLWDGIVIATNAAVLLSTKHLVSHDREDGDRAELWSLDQKVVDWGRHDDAMRTSDVGVAMAGAFAIVDSLVSGKHEGGEVGAVKLTIYAESALTAGALTEVVKHLVQRPRPCTYQPDRRWREGLSCAPDDDDAYLSFFSGHTSTTAALAASATYLAYREDPDGSRGSWTLAGGLALTSLVASERVRAGKHFPADVLTGAAVGATVGVLVPHLHHVSREGGGGGAAVASDGQMITVGGVF